jgi:hypothetical protein
LIGEGDAFEVYISVYTNEHSKVIEFSFTPCKNIFETKRERDQKSHVIEESKESEDTFMIEPVQDGTRDPFKDPLTASNTMQLSLKSLHLSFIKQGVELFTLNVIGMDMSMLNTASEQIMEACISRIQIDNTVDIEPLFPVVLKPRCTAGENPHNHDTMEGVEPLF